MPSSDSEKIEQLEEQAIETRVQLAVMSRDIGSLKDAVIDLKETVKKVAWVVIVAVIATGLDRLLT